MRLLLLAALAAVPFIAPEAQGLRASGPAVPLAGAANAPLTHALWSPTGEWLAATRPDHRGLWLLTPDGGTSQLREGAGYAPEWSADGTALLLRADRQDGIRRQHAVALVDLASGETTLLTEWRDHMPTVPRFSADETEALLLGGDGDIERFTTGRTASGERGATVLTTSRETVAANGVAKRPLAPEAQMLNATLSPDRQRLAFEVLGGGLAVMNVDGTGRVDLGVGHRPAWSPDGQWVAFMRTADDGYH
ncbi:MAG: hypothetical protein AAFQ43_03045, partial [Bacteroidota bacterium]